MKSFAALFAGRDDVAGRYLLPSGVKPSAKGKLAGRAQTLREVITDASYKAHNAGKQRLGIVPIRPSDNTVSWFALDADVYKSPTLHRDLAKKINRAMLPLVITKSKSGGAHLWCFFRDPVPAVRARDIAKDYVKKLGLDPKTEIFPKQETIDVADDGSWINLPYFGDTCVGLDETGERELDLKEFLSHANSRLVTLEDAQIAKKNSNDLGGSDAPPCVDAMLDEGLEEGGRNSAMAQIALYLLKSSPDDWEDRLAEINETKCHPPLDMDEIKTIIKSVRRKNYQYLCNQQPMCSLCDKKACLTRKYGVGDGENKEKSSVVMIDALEKIEGDEPTYRVTMMGRTFEVPVIEHLMNFRLFRIQVAKRLDVVLPAVTQKMWDAYIGDMLRDMDHVEAPADTIMAERVVTEFMDWAGRGAARSGPEVLIGGQLWYDEKSKLLYFRAQDFLEMCDRKFKITRNHVWRFLRDRGATETMLTIKGVEHRVWTYPLTDERLITGRERT